MVFSCSLQCAGFVVNYTSGVMNPLCQLSYVAQKLSDNLIADIYLFELLCLPVLHRSAPSKKPFPGFVCSYLQPERTDLTREAECSS